MTIVNGSISSSPFRNQDPASQSRNRIHPSSKHGQNRSTKVVMALQNRADYAARVRNSS